MEGQKSNNFCVETKGVCFFCFHENSRFYDGKTPKESDRRSCNISLKCLSRYLNVNFDKVFKLNIPLQYKSTCASDLIVPLCQECAAVTRNFSKLYRELELVKMHMHSCVCTIREKIVKADCEQNVCDKYKKRWITSNPVDAIQAEIVNNLRKETKEKCSSKLETALPRVKLDKCCTRNAKNSIANSLKRSFEENVPIKNKRTLNVNVSDNDKPVNAPCSSTQSATEQDFKSTKIISQQLPLQNAQSVQPVEAQICRSLPNVPKNTVVLKSPCTATANNNNTTLHLETPRAPFLPSRPEQTTPLASSEAFLYPNQPKLSLPVFSNTPLVSSSNTASSSTNNTNKRVWPSKSTEKPRQQRLAAGAESALSSYDCVHCEEKFSEKSTLRTHVVKSHSEQFFTTLKDRNLSPAEFKTIVYLLFKQVAKSHTIDCSGSHSKNIYSCPYCKLETDTDGDVYAHMFRFHYSDLTSKLLALQKETIIMRGGGGEITPSSSNASQKINTTTTTTTNSLLCECNMRYASKRTLQFHKKYNCKLINNRGETVALNNVPVSTTTFTPPKSSTSSRTVDVAKFHCAYCEKKFPFYYDHRVHLLTNHRIEEFSKYTSPGVTSEQLDTELKCILQKYRKLPGNDNAGGCLFCTEIFSNVAELQNHILVGHFDVVVFKLRGIIPQQSLLYVNDSNPDNLIHTNSHSLEVVPSATTAINPAIYEGVEVDASSRISVDQDTASPISNNAVEVIMQDPLSLDFIELEPESLFCKEEEHLKMEWLFSFIEEEEETQDQPESQQSTEDAKSFNLGNNDSELILP